MRTLILSILLVSSVFSKNYKEFANEMGYELQYDVALKKAQKQKKDIMFVMVANFCPWCSKFEKLVLGKKDIDAKIHRKYIPLIMNREEKQFPKKYDSPMIPTVYFIDHVSEVVRHKVVGYNNKQDFINIINK
jgi:thioredoxin-related protein